MPSSAGGRCGAAERRRLRGRSRFRSCPTAIAPRLRPPELRFREGEAVLLADLVRLQPVGGGSVVEAWLEGMPVVPGQHPMYISQVVQSCELTGQIAFGSDRDRNSEIHVMNADASNVRRVTRQ
jgi:hypothetical protein